MKKKLHFPIGWTCFVLLFVFLLGFIVLMGNAQAEGCTVMTVTGDHVREREEPNLDAYVTGHYNTGDKVQVLNIENGWALLSNGYYMNANFLTEDELVPTPSNEFFVTAPGARERMEPNASGKIVCEHGAGESVFVDGNPVDGWYKLTNGNYIAEELISQNYNDIYTHCFEHYQDILIVSIRNQDAKFYHYGFRANADVVTGMANTTPTPTGISKAGRKICGVYLNGNPNTYVAYGVYFKDGYLVHDAESFPWRKSGFGGDIYKTNGSNGCVNTPTEFSRIFYERCSEHTFILIIP